VFPLSPLKAVTLPGVRELFPSWVFFLSGTEAFVGVCCPQAGENFLGCALDGFLVMKGGEAVIPRLPEP